MSNFHAILRHIRARRDFIKIIVFPAQVGSQKMGKSDFLRNHQN
jgi:hypothetical protein